MTPPYKSEPICWQHLHLKKQKLPKSVRHNPHYITVSEEEAQKSTITLQGQDVLDLLDPRLVARMSPAYRTSQGNMIQPNT